MQFLDDFTSFRSHLLRYRPVAMNKDGSAYNKELTQDPYPTWKKLEELVEKGKIRNIGISKYVASWVFPEEPLLI